MERLSGETLSHESLSQIHEIDYLQVRYSMIVNDMFSKTKSSYLAIWNSKKNIQQNPTCFPIREQLYWMIQHKVIWHIHYTTLKSHKIQWFCYKQHHSINNTIIPVGSFYQVWNLSFDIIWLCNNPLMDDYKNIWNVGYHPHL